MDSKSDAELVTAARGGNQQAFGELVLRYQRQIYGLACILLGDRSEAEDIAQEAFLRAWLNCDLLSDPSKFGPWVRRIVFGVSIDWLRAFRPDLFRLSDHEAELVLFAIPASSESALQAMESIELREKVWRAISTLPPRYRLPLTMFHMDGLSHRKVAEAIGVPESTVRSLVTRARQRLEPLLAGYAAEVLPALQDVLREQQLRRAIMLHIVDGESVAGTLREAAVPGEIRTYGDLKYEGPAPAGLDRQSWCNVRAQFLSDKLGFEREDALAYLQASFRTLDAAAKHEEEIVLWLDYRLSDQLILIELLDWFSRSKREESQLSLICVGQYAGIRNFVGLGQLTSDQFPSIPCAALPWARWSGAIEIENAGRPPCGKEPNVSNRTAHIAPMVRWIAHGATPNSRLRNSCAPASEAAKPTIRPRPTSRPASRSTMRRMSPRSAPTARRSPTSFVRRATVYDITP
jgi:RNA polymerase sigma factor (sigma-70 family)